jgi:hypothetical protein
LLDHSKEATTDVFDQRIMGKKKGNTIMSRLTE